MEKKTVPGGGAEDKEEGVEDKLVGLVGTRGYMAPEVSLVLLLGLFSFGGRVGLVGTRGYMAPEPVGCGRGVWDPWAEALARR
eukprot:scaffold15905_cov73-Isochrysis_galbana.AAC.1